MVRSKSTLSQKAESTVSQMQKVRSCPDDYYQSPDHAAAAKIIAANSHKPIRKMGPMDYSLGAVTRLVKVYKAKKTEKQKRDEARSALSQRCSDLLTERGAMTTSEIARELATSSAAISAALRDLSRVMCDQTKGQRKNFNGSFSSCTLWMMPVRK